jgi:putative ABC transport system permease protein
LVAEGEFSIYTNSDLRRRVLDIFDQTFAVTSVLRAISVFVAIAGVLLSLTTLGPVEREREIGILPFAGGILCASAGFDFLGSGDDRLAGRLRGPAVVVRWPWSSALGDQQGILRIGPSNSRYPLEWFFRRLCGIIPAALLAAWLPARRASLIPPAQASEIQVRPRLCLAFLCRSSKFRSGVKREALFVVVEQVASPHWALRRSLLIAASVAPSSGGRAR